MADPLHNATCRLRKAASYLSGTNDLTRTHEKADPVELACSMRQLDVQTAQGIFGTSQVEAWRVRIANAGTVPTASMVDIRRAGSGEDWIEYRVQTSRRVGRTTNLLVTRA